MGDMQSLQDIFSTEYKQKKIKSKGYASSNPQQRFNIQKQFDVLKKINRYGALLAALLIACFFKNPQQFGSAHAQEIPREQTSSDISAAEIDFGSHPDGQILNPAKRMLSTYDDDGNLDDDANEILAGADQDSEEAERASAGGYGEGTEEGDEAEEEAPAAVDNLSTAASTARPNVPGANRMNEFETADLKDRYERGEYKVMLDSITPRGGPQYGTTRVTVRASNLEDLVDAYPDPKCKFGTNNLIVEATYVRCTKRPLNFYEKERRSGIAMNETCVECEASPEKDTPEIVSFTVSLTGSFDDVYSSLPYRYYPPAHVDTIYPRYGPKDGDTVVQVWGANFLDLGDDFRCNFGTRSTKANFINANFIWCRAPFSDVVNRPMPFSVSLNRQQNSLQNLDYWYYSDPQIQKIVPDYGPMGGGTKVVMKGSGFMPFDWRLDVNNQNDTFCDWGTLGKTPAAVTSSTEAECLSPENHLHLEWAPVNLTLNNQNYTDEDIRFIYYNPPKIISAEPLQGPVKGGTEVNLWGTQFERNRNITCFFGDIEVQAKYVSRSHLTCESPTVQQPGEHRLVVKYANDRFQSDVLTYTYFADPALAEQDPVQPHCGPTGGFTQVTVRGRNFVEVGFGLAKCVFNSTYRTNATVLDANTMVCDSPPLESVNGDLWYNVSVTLDGDFVANASAKFYYYENPTISSISPWLGPMSGDTESVVRGTGFDQSTICDLKVRYGRTHLVPRAVTSGEVVVASPAVGRPGQVVVSVSGNNQQFIDDRTLHFRDLENTFEYYQLFYVEHVSPESLSNAGNSPLKLTGMLFDQFKWDNGTERHVTIECRFVDAAGTVLGTPRNMTRVSDTQQICAAPATTYTGDVKVELSLNGQQWQDIQVPVKYYNGPKVTAVSPTYGVTKNPNSDKLTISGENFACPNDDCSRIRVRFTNYLGDQIYTVGEWVAASGTIKCLIPKYPAPETLDVDVSFNDQDYTNDRVQFGFQDPYVLAISPRLVSTHGATKLTLSGYGFVHLEEARSQVVMKDKDDRALQCSGTVCTKVYSVSDEHAATVEAFEQAAMMKDGGENIGFEPWYVNMENPDGDFTANGIDLRYYKDPVFNGLSSQFAYSNEEKPVLIDTDFSWGAGNDLESFRKFATFTCRFTSTSDATKQIVTPAIMEAKPIGQYNRDSLPDQIRCRTPKWGSVDTATVDVSVNGQDYAGAFTYSFVDALKIYRISPLSGPVGGETKVKLFGGGFTASAPHEASVYVKFGTIEAQSIDKSEVSDYQWNDREYHDGFNTARTLLADAEKNDVKLDDGRSVKKYIAALSPDVSRAYTYDSPDVQGIGGPVYVQVGEKVAIQRVNHGASRQEETAQIEVVYPDSSDLEFYFYREPIVTKIEPTSGLTSGGTLLELTGAWFDQKPQYGVHPFCKIGSHVISGQFVQTTRILCKTPPSEETGEPSAVAVSLNGEDFHETGFTFSYYEKPVITDIQPRSGSVEGGTEIWLKGTRFSNITHGMKSVRCRFRQIAPTNQTEGSAPAFDEDNAPTKYIPAYYIDRETMKCASPAGWTGGDQVKVDLTFNGVDYTDANFIFSFYNIFGSFPKSGPADAVTQYIQIRGKGFRDSQTILCVLNNVQLPPLAVRSNVIRCPMVLDDWPSTTYASVDFHVLIDGSRRDFGNFHYYKQIQVDEVTPLLGPQEGKGAIYFIGRDFRDDFENAKLSCRIGNTLATAQLIDGETVRCLISNKLPLVEQGESLQVSLALNSYSWAPSDFSFQPYGISNLYPSAGPISENTNIMVTGKGFDNELKAFARCKFGTDDNYVVVEAQVLDNEHLICKSPPEGISLPDDADDAISMPFSVAFQEDIYYPYTEGPQKFRLYRHPVLVDISPPETQVGKLTEVYVYADDSDSFWQPIPSDEGDASDQYGIRCKFGRFGSGAATYINKTTILCLTPNIQDDPSDISEETVTVTVAMNGVDYNDEYSSLAFTFIGTGGRISTWVVIMGTLIFGLLIISAMICCSALQEFMKEKARENQPRTQANDRGGLGLRVNSRSSSALVGRRTVNDRSLGSRAQQ